MMPPPPKPPLLPPLLPPAAPPPPPPLPPDPKDLVPAPPAAVLRRLFLTLFLRGFSARGLQRQGAPKSIGRKLGSQLVMYALIGLVVALGFHQKSAFALSIYLHAATFAFLGMFVAASAGELLFNQQEPDILLHRPVEPRALLWAKVWVLVQVSLWLAGAFNLAGFFAGWLSATGTWRYPLAHVLSTAAQALFCAGSVVVVYQLCLRWFGRERLNNLMTTAQVFFAITVVAAGQVVPRVIGQFGTFDGLTAETWWVGLLPPAWFAGFDDAVAGTGAASSWLLAAVAMVVTGLVLWLAFGRLADDYLRGLQAVNESAGGTGVRPVKNQGRRWLNRLVEMPPLNWWLRDSVVRTSFLLTLAYLSRDRDVKLRVYPGIAPMLIMPFIFLLQGHGHHRPGPGFSGFGIAFSGAYLGLIPMLTLGMLSFSQQWQATDLFRVAPLAGPARLFLGARRAVLLFMTLPLAAVFVLVALVTGADAASLALLLPGMVMLPLYALVPGLRDGAVPLSRPTEAAKSASRGLSMIMVMIISMGLAVLATFAWSGGWFGIFLAVEIVAAAAAYVLMNLRLNAIGWSPVE